MADVEILKWQENKNLQWLSRDMIFDAVQRIDNTVFHEKALATKESDIARYEAYKNSYIFAVSEKEIIGYVCYFPITKTFPAFQKLGISKQFSKLLNEELNSINIEDIVSYAFTSGGEHFLNGLGLAAVKDMGDNIQFMKLLGKVPHPIKNDY